MLERNKNLGIDLDDCEERLQLAREENQRLEVQWAKAGGEKSILEKRRKENHGAGFRQECHEGEALVILEG